MSETIRYDACMRTSAAAPDGELFSEVLREPNLSDQVVGSITEAVISGRLSRGQTLASERDLAVQFGVSRTVIREAIRSLIALGLVESRSGRGMQIATVGPDAISRSMSLFLHGNAAIDYTKVHEVRTALEIQIAGIAAERATAEDLRDLRELVHRLVEARDDPERAAKFDVQFHREIAAATHNELFAVILGSIQDVLLHIRRAAFDAPGMVDYAVHAHGQILDSLEERDPERAREAMRAHLGTAERAWSAAASAAA